MDTIGTLAPAVGVQGERVVALGSIEDILARTTPSTEIVDLRGRTLLPGFTENHLHVLETSVDAGWVDCSASSVDSIAGIVAALAERAESTPEGQWVLGWGFNDRRLRERRYPTRLDLDAASTHHPIALRHIESMSWTANTLGLRRMGIQPDTPDPAGGRLLRDGDGAPLGPMWDNCRVAFVFPALPAPTQEELVESFGQTLRRLNALGITSVNDAGVVSSDQLYVYQRLRDERQLSARVYLNLYVAYGSGWDASHPAHRLFVSGVSTGFGDPWLRIGPAVIGVDGGTGSRGAALSEPYRDAEQPDYGTLRVEQDFLTEFCVEAQRRGFQVGAVAHGDAAIQMTLDAFERAMTQHPRANLRHRLEHAYLWREDLFARARRLGVVLSSQPTLMALYDRSQTLDAWGEARAEWAFPYRSCFDAGVVASGGSDCPVVTPDPIAGLDALINRRIGGSGEQLGPSQAISIMDALRVYTINGAYGDHAEALWGSIEPGKYADLIVLNEDVRKLPKERVRELRVDRTYVAGERVYAASDE